MDFGTSGLDLAYEVMRGYDALVLVDATRQGGEPGTLYVIEPERDGVRGRDRGRRDDRPARHGPADGAALRQRDRRLARQGRRRSAASPARSTRSGSGLTPAGRGRGRARGRRSCCETIAELRTDAAYAGLMHELSIACAVVDTAVRHAAGRRGDARSACASGACARSCPTR